MVKLNLKDNTRFSKRVSRRRGGGSLSSLSTEVEKAGTQTRKGARGRERGLEIKRAESSHAGRGKEGRGVDPPPTESLPSSRLWPGVQ